MAFRIEIIENAVIITDTITGVLKLDEPAKNVYYEHNALVKKGVYSLTINRGSIFSQPLSECVDASNVPFTVATLQTFSRTYLGKSKGGGNQPTPSTYEQVEFRADLPTDLNDPIIGTVYLVEKPTTILLGVYTSYQSGLYIREANNGTLSDWRKLNVKVKFTDGEFSIVKTSNQSLQAKYDLTLLTANRTYQHQNKDGVIAHLDDLPDFSPLLQYQIIFSNGTGGFYYDWIRASTKTFPFPSNEGASNLNYNQGYGFLIDGVSQGVYNKISAYIDQINFPSNQTADLWFGLMDSSFQLITETNITLDSNNDQGYISTSIPVTYTQIPDSKFFLIGMNNNVNGGQTASFKRQNANQTNNSDVCFTFNFSNGGGFPSDLSNPNDRSNTNTVFYINLYSD